LTGTNDSNKKEKRMKLQQPSLAASRRRSTAISSFLLAALLAGTIAWAQSPDTLPAATRQLAEFMPPGNVLTFNSYRDADVGTALKDELAGLDWQAGAATLSQLLRVVQQQHGTGGELDPVIAMLDDFADGSSSMQQPGSHELLGRECPDFDTQLAGLEGRFEAISAGLAPQGFSEIIAGIGFAPANPLPAVTSLLRFDAATAGIAGTTVTALLDCLRSDPDVQVVQRNQDDSEFFEISIGYNARFVIAFEHDTLLFGSNPELIRHALRLLNGSQEASLNGSPLWQARQRFEQSHASFGYTLDLAEAATVLESYSGMIASDDAERALFDRISAALKTAGGITGNFAALENGLLHESLLLVDPAGGDAALADLLLRSGHTVTAPELVPQGALRVSSHVLDLKADLAYLQGWADTITAALGSDSIDLLDAVRNETGLDLNALLLDWTGNEVHMLQLATVYHSPVDLLFGSNKVILVPVTSATAARKAVEQLADFLGHLPELPGSTGSRSRVEYIAGEELQAAARVSTYRGIDITRLQIGPVADIGIAVLPDTLLLAMPARALQPVLDLQLDGGAEEQPYPFASILSEPVSLERYDTGTDFRALVDLLAPFTQPAAFAAHMAAAVHSTGFEEDWSGGWGWQDEAAAGLASSPLTTVTPGSYSGELQASEEGQQDEYGNSVPSFNYYGLEGVAAGDTVTATLSGDFDTFLYLLDSQTGRVLDANDDWDYDWNTSRLQFTVTAGESPVLAVSSYWGDEGGSYTLDIAAQPSAAAAPAAELPPFADTLDLFDLLPEAARIIGSHLGSKTGWQQREGNVIYSRSLLDISW
jgi:hypothetical protein